LIPPLEEEIGPAGINGGADFLGVHDASTTPRRPSSTGQCPGCRNLMSRQYSLTVVLSVLIVVLNAESGKEQFFLRLGRSEPHLIHSLKYARAHSLVPRFLLFLGFF
jgi:hypothetical protein